MKSVVKPKFHQYNLYRRINSHKFRNTDYRFGKRQHNLLFLNNALSNPTYEYQIITVPLVGGTYQFKIKSIDNLNNINTGITANATITDKLWYPSNFAITSVVEATDDNTVNFRWNAPTGGISIDNYIVYGNGGSGFTIDRGTPLATIPYGTNVAQVTGLIDGTWFFVVESEASSVETVNQFTLRRVLPATDDPGDPNGPTINPFDEDFVLQNISLKNVSVGKCQIQFYWFFGSQASYFRIYHDGGTGTIDWNTYDFRYARQNSKVQTFTTDQICTEEGDFTYKIGIRAESSTGIVGTNTYEYLVILDGKAPDEVTGVSAGGV